MLYRKWKSFAIKKRSKKYFLDDKNCQKRPRLGVGEGRMRDFSKEAA